MGDFEFNGQLNMIAKINKHKKLTEQKTILKKYVEQTARQSQQLVPVGWGKKYPVHSASPKGYRGGQLKRSMKIDYSADGLTGTISYNTDYAFYQEYGTRNIPARKYLSTPFLSNKVKFIKELRG